MFQTSQNISMNALLLIINDLISIKYENNAESPTATLQNAERNLQTNEKNLFYDKNRILLVIKINVAEQKLEFSRTEKIIIIKTKWPARVTNKTKPTKLYQRKQTKSSKT